MSLTGYTANGGGQPLSSCTLDNTICDGNTSTGFGAVHLDSAQSTGIIDLGSIQSVSSVTFVVGYYRLLSEVLEWSTNGTTWTNIAPLPGFPYHSYAYSQETQTITGPWTARYFRLSISDQPESSHWPTNAQAFIAEISVGTTTPLYASTSLVGVGSLSASGTVRYPGLQWGSGYQAATPNDVVPGQIADNGGTGVSLAAPTSAALTVNIYVNPAVTVAQFAGTIGYANTVSDAWDYSNDGFTWTPITVTNGFTLAAGGGAFSLQSQLWTPSAPVTAKFFRYSIQDTGSVGNVEVTSLRLNTTAAPAIAATVPITNPPLNNDSGGGCIWNCPDAVMVQAGSYSFIDNTSHPYIPGSEIQVYTIGVLCNVFSFVVPAGSYRAGWFLLEHTVVKNTTAARLFQNAPSGSQISCSTPLPINYGSPRIYTGKTPGTYAQIVSGGPSWPAALQNSSASVTFTIRADVWPEAPGQSFYSLDPNAFKFEDDWTCFSLALLPAVTGTGSLGTGDTVSLPATTSYYDPVVFSSLPAWVQSGYTWIIQDNSGAIVTDSAHSGSLSVVDHTIDCQRVSVHSTCSPYPNTAPFTVGSPMYNGASYAGPFTATFLVDVTHDGINGWAYHVMVSQPFDWVVDQICPNAGGTLPPPPPPPPYSYAQFGADVFDGIIQVAWLSGTASNWPNLALKTSTHRAPSKYIGSGSSGWETPVTIETDHASALGIVYMAQGRLLLQYTYKSTKLYRISDDNGETFSASAQADLGEFCMGGRGNEITYRVNKGAALSYCRDNQGVSWTGYHPITGVLSASDSAAVYTGSQFVMLYTHTTTNELWSVATSNGFAWGTSIDVGLTGTVCGMCCMASGRIAALVNSSGYKVIWSDDRGQHWSAGVSVSIGADTSIIPKILAVNSDLCIVSIVSDAPVFKYSKDGGSTFA